MVDSHAMKEKALVGAKRFSVIVAYLWVLLSLFELHEWMILKQHNLAYEAGFKLGFALINALVLGKVIFIAEELHVGEHLKYKPLYHPILYKSAVFAVILICFHIAEEVIRGMLHGKTFTLSFPVLGGGGMEGILIVGVILFVVLIPFFAFREFGRILGEEQLKALIFKHRTTAGTKEAEVVHAPVTKGDDRVA